MLDLCSNDGGFMFEWCSIDVWMILDWCLNDAEFMLEWCWIDVWMMLDWCSNDAGSMPEGLYNVFRWCLRSLMVQEAFLMITDTLYIHPKSIPHRFQIDPKSMSNRYQNNVKTMSKRGQIDVVKSMSDLHKKPSGLFFFDNHMSFLQMCRLVKTCLDLCRPAVWICLNLWRFAWTWREICGGYFWLPLSRPHCITRPVQTCLDSFCICTDLSKRV